MKKINMMIIAILMTALTMNMDVNEETVNLNKPLYLFDLA